MQKDNLRSPQPNTIFQDPPALTSGIIVPIALASQFIIPITGHYPKEALLMTYAITYLQIPFLCLSILLAWIRVRVNFNSPTYPLTITSLILTASLLAISFFLQSPLYLIPALLIFSFTTFNKTLKRMKV